MKCNHPGCHAFLHPDDAVYPELAVIEKTLGREVAEKDIDNFAIHFTHDTKAPRFDRRATLLFLATFYRGIVPNAKAQKTPAPTPKPTLNQLKNRAAAIRFGYGVNYPNALNAAKRAFERGTSLEKELQAGAIAERMVVAKCAKRAAKQAASVEAA